VTVLILSLVLAVAGCTGLVLAGRGMWQGWAVGLAVQPVWAAFAIVTHGYGLLLTCLMYGSVYARNLLRWRRQPTAPTAGMSDPIGWDDQAQRVHDVGTVLDGRLIHYSTCWCRTPQPLRPSPVVGSRNA
jgi:hypothetical protein